MAAEPIFGALVAPEPSQRFHGEHRTLGRPLADFQYRNAAGGVVLHVCRYKHKPDPTAPAETDEPFITKWWIWDTANHEWDMRRGAPDPAPLWQADRLFGEPQQPVYLVDNEESAEALQQLIASEQGIGLVTCWAGGAPSLRRVDWTLLQDRPVTLWPTQGSEALRAALTISSSLFNLVHQSGHELLLVRDSSKPPRWNAAEAIATGWTWEAIQEFLISHTTAVGHNAPMQVVEIDDTHMHLEEYETTTIGRMDKVKDLPLSQKWHDYGLARANNGLPHSNLYNVVKVIEYHKGAYCDVWLDEFHNKVMTRGSAEAPPREWSDADTLEFTRFIQDPNGVGLPKISTGTVHDAAILCASKNKRNEVREWLQQLSWDGQERLHDVLPMGWGTGHSPYLESVGRCFVMGAVARILRPGCQVDNLPVFEGPEGIRKSSALMALASEQWFDVPSYSLGDHDFYQCLPGKWILEFAEMANLGGVTGEKLRAVITRRSDTYRPSYGRVSVTFPRMCVFSATTNETEWNKSTTGARRFWPVTCGKINLAWITEMREQLFAEAVARVEKKLPWWDVPNTAAVEEQILREPEDAWKELVSSYVANQTECATDQILECCLGITDRSKWDQRAKNRVAHTLRRLGWVQKVTSRDGRSCRVWTIHGPQKTPLRGLETPFPD